MKLSSNISFSEFLLEAKSVYSKDVDEVKILKTLDNGSYIIQKEKLIGGISSDSPTILEVAYNKSGDYIGDKDMAKMLAKRGISPELIDKNHKVCSIGFNEKEEKWYGWSHRAIFGFGVGHKVKIGDANFMPSNKEEFLEKLKSWYNDPMYQNKSFKILPQGIEVKYEIIADNDKPVSLTESLKIIDIPIMINEAKSNEIVKFPTTWGKGKWEAKTLNDCKTMAIDFANSVS